MEWALRPPLNDRLKESRQRRWRSGMGAKRNGSVWPMPLKKSEREIFVRLLPDIEPTERD